MSNTFEEQYAPTLNEVFTTHARQQLQQGVDGLATARDYAERGKPDFALAFLLLLDIPEDEKREVLARAYERRARLSDEKAKQLDKQFHRPFPLIKLEAQKDRVTANAIRGSQRPRVES
ncbi:MAG TPA: hypothetical protein VNE38_18100 [Ktedonobacteraceae bacterium]|nr:hypothetical protein [Ktedonobacteraceae bacterium]